MGHRRAPAEERFSALYEVTDTGCWQWTGYVKPNGYAQFWPGGGGRVAYAHRWSYEHHVGPIPDGLEIDHLCRNRSCVNPHHLEAVTRRENQARSPLTIGNVKAARTSCPSGHPYDEENTYTIPGRRHRLCRTCRRIRNREAQRRIRSGLTLAVVSGSRTGSSA